MTNTSLNITQMELSIEQICGIYMYQLIDGKYKKVNNRVLKIAFTNAYMKHDYKKIHFFDVFKEYCILFGIGMDSNGNETELNNAINSIHSDLFRNGLLSLFMPIDEYAHMIACMKAQAKNDIKALFALILFANDKKLFNKAYRLVTSKYVVNSLESDHNSVDIMQIISCSPRDKYINIYPRSATYGCMNICDEKFLYNVRMLTGKILQLNLNDASIGYSVQSPIVMTNPPYKTYKMEDIT